MDKFQQEMNFYNFQSNRCSKPPCGHYTQVAWATTKAVGCAVHRCQRLGGVPWTQPAYLVVCNYNPSGNWKGQRPYQYGRACSRCPTDAPHCVNGLCSASRNAQRSQNTPRSQNTQPVNTRTPQRAVPQNPAPQQAIAQRRPSTSRRVDTSTATRLQQLELTLQAAVAATSADQARLARLEALLRGAIARQNSIANQQGQAETRASAHLDGGHSRRLALNAGDVATFWSSSAKHSHMRGGFRYQNGRLIAPRTGYYYVYSQLWYVSGTGVRLYLYANDRRLSVAGAGSATGQTTWTGGVFRLNAGEGLSVRVGRRGERARYMVWPGGAHSLMGAFML